MIVTTWNTWRLVAFCLVLVTLLPACSNKYVTTQGQEIVLKDHEAMFLSNCKYDGWWDNHSPAANCGFFGKDIIPLDPVGGLRFLKQGCDQGDDLSCLEFASNAYKLSTDDTRYKLLRSYTLPTNEIMAARTYAMDICTGRELVIRGSDSTKWLCYFTGKLHSEVNPIDIPNAKRAFKQNCDKRGDCEELKKLGAH